MSDLNGWKRERHEPEGWERELDELRDQAPAVPERDRRERSVGEVLDELLRELES